MGYEASICGIDCLHKSYVRKLSLTVTSKLMYLRFALPLIVLCALDQIGGQALRRWSFRHWGGEIHMAAFRTNGVLVYRLHDFRLHSSLSKQGVRLLLIYAEKNLTGIQISALLTFTVVEKAISDGFQLLVRELGKKCIRHNVRCVVCRDQAALNFVRAGWKIER